MTLRQWMEKNNVTQAEIAKKAKVSQSAISRYIASDAEQRRSPSGPHIARIAKATNHEVTLADWPGCKAGKAAA